MTDKPERTNVFKLAAATDLLLGLVLVAVGLAQDESVLVILGAALAVMGTAVASWLIVRSSRPTQL
jgi:hypothetical protein